MFDRGLRALRETWRETCFNTWQVIQALDMIRPLARALVSLSDLFRKLPAHAAAVATGGVWTEQVPENGAQLAARGLYRAFSVCCGIAHVTSA